MGATGSAVAPSESSDGGSQSQGEGLPLTLPTLSQNEVALSSWHHLQQHQGLPNEGLTRGPGNLLWPLAPAQDGALCCQHCHWEVPAGCWGSFLWQ